MKVQAGLVVGLLISPLQISGVGPVSRLRLAFLVLMGLMGLGEGKPYNCAKHLLLVFSHLCGFRKRVDCAS